MFILFSFAIIKSTLLNTLIPPINNLISNQKLFLSTYVLHDYYLGTVFYHIKNNSIVISIFFAIQHQEDSLSESDFSYLSTTKGNLEYIRSFHSSLLSSTIPLFQIAVSTAIISSPV